MTRRVSVRTYSGFKADERPTSFSFDGLTVEVLEVIDRWYDIEHNYFKVRGDDGREYLLRHDLNADAWELVEPNNSVPCG